MTTLFLIRILFTLSSKICGRIFCKVKHRWSGMEKWASLIFVERIHLVNYDQIPILNFQHMF